MTFKEDSLPTDHLIFLRHFSLMLVGCQTSHDTKSTTTFDTPCRFTKELLGAFKPLRKCQVFASVHFIDVYLFNMNQKDTHSFKFFVLPS